MVTSSEAVLMLLFTWWSLK